MRCKTFTIKRFLSASEIEDIWECLEMSGAKWWTPVGVGFLTKIHYDSKEPKTDG